MRPETLFAGLLSWRDAALFGLIYLVAVANQHLMTLVLVALIPWAAWGQRRAWYAISLVAIIRVVNFGFGTVSPYAGILSWLIAIVGSLRIYVGARRLPGSFYWLLSFCLFAIIASLQVSKSVDVSVMKAVSFFIVSSAALVASENMTLKDVEMLKRWLISGICVVGMFCLLTLPLPTIAYNTNGKGFQGIFSQPQQLGVILTPFVAWVVVRAFDNRTVKPHSWELFIVLVGIVIMVMSRARTAMLATFMSVTLTVIVHLFRSKARSLRKDFAKIAGLVFGFVLLITVASLSTDAVMDLVDEIVFKASGTETVGEAFEQSRGAGAKQQLKDFADAPLTGHGFGVYPFGVLGGERSIVRVLGIPISAPAEKGFAFTAVLEEVGIIGGLLFYGLILSMARRAAKSPRPEVLALFLGAVFVNFGEAVIFSPGGIGLFMWLVIALSLASGRLDARN